MTAWTRSVRALLAACAAGLVLAAGGCGRDVVTTAAGSGPDPSGTLVLYDTTGAYGTLGELYATEIANLVSHFGTYRAEPVRRYAAGESARYRAVVYVGSTYDEPLPGGFLDDVARGATPVLWCNDNVWQLMSRHQELGGRYGFALRGFDPAPVAQVRYRGTSLTRDAAKAGSLMRFSVTDPAKARPIGDAVLGDGSTVPWGLRAGNLTYIGENPLTFVSADDRYLAFTDLLFDLLAPHTAVRHRALVRIEDVGPQSDPAKLRAIADYLHGRGVPFSVAVYAEYDDPAGRYSGGRPIHRRLSEAPDLVDALRYMVANGGTLIMHGFTHAYAGGPNPYGVSAEDFEFYRAHVDATNAVVLDGPVPEDSPTWATDRITAARAEWTAAGLPPATIFEFPHYAASVVDYQAITPLFAARYEQSMYYPGLLSGGPMDPTRSASQYFPYPVRDVYGKPVIPETLGNVETQEFNQHAVRLPADILASGRRQLVVRDGVASFFYHPFLGLQYLPALVEGIQGMGYTFVAAPTLVQP